MRKLTVALVLLALPGCASLGNLSDPFDRRNPANYSRQQVGAGHGAGAALVYLPIAAFQLLHDILTGQ